MIGRTLDKYRVLEEVGQGGMAVVYKGLDTALKREVAIKVLHAHLADSDEARRRFEREAQAVAKLRHENILEIFDYSGKDSPDSYIVTEFIHGGTLKRFMARHTIGFPEIGAMIVAEVCRALCHAHSVGVLHRDIKPENIMIRDDGVVKLTDFGIAQIVDAQRMTVTGQLLGSPAYMSPEHVEGRPLDFRTDVFSVGILLYQLATGELPFKGRNPHEILKRIAECKYLDARVVNPRVADSLNRIIARSLAQKPDDRYPEIALLLEDLNRFLAEVELGDPRAELSRFFAEPVAYEQALRQRIIAALIRRAHLELGEKRTASALACCNRVLAIHPDNEEILALVDRVTRRRRFLRTALGVGALVLLGAAGMAGVTWWPKAEPAAPPPAGGAPVLVAPAARPAATPPRAETAAAPDARVNVPESPGTKGQMARRNEPRDTHEPVARATGGPARTFRLVPRPINATFSVDGGAFRPITGGGVEIPLGAGPHTILFRHERCEDAVEKIDADEAGRTVNVRLKFKPSRVIPRCPGADAITVDGRVADSGAPVEIVDFAGARKLVTVEFLVGGRTVTRSVEVVAGDDPHEVSCD